MVTPPPPPPPPPRPESELLLMENLLPLSPCIWEVITPILTPRGLMYILYQERVFSSLGTILFTLFIQYREPNHHDLYSRCCLHANSCFALPDRSELAPFSKSLFLICFQSSLPKDMLVNAPMFKRVKLWKKYKVAAAIDGTFHCLCSSRSPFLNFTITKTQGNVPASERNKGAFTGNGIFPLVNPVVVPSL